MPLFLLLILILTSCSKQVVEKKIILDKPITLEEPMPLEKIIPGIIPGIIPETIIQKVEKKYGIFARNRYKAFNAKLRKLQNSSTEVKLEEINNFFNGVSYSDDKTIWGQRDYWATPLEFLAKDKGDCEDYVIAKYFTLRNLGIESKKLYFSYVKAIRFKKSHMVLSYFKTPYSTPLILDSINFKIFPADKRKDLIPVYNYNWESYHAKQNGQKGYRKWDRLINNIKRNKL
jgi:predicted transglutaminase-like cysteine proteinase